MLLREDSRTDLELAAMVVRQRVARATRGRGPCLRRSSPRPARTCARRACKPAGSPTRASPAAPTAKTPTFVSPGLGLFVVADGIGGAAGGGVASRLAVDTVFAELADPARSGDALDLQHLITAVQRANARRASCAGREVRERAGMGTTLTALLLRGERAALALVGDLARVSPPGPDAGSAHRGSHGRQRVRPGRPHDAGGGGGLRGPARHRARRRGRRSRRGRRTGSRGVAR